MGLPDENHDLGSLLKSIKDKRNWVTEITNLVLLIEALDDLGKSTSIREVSKLIHQSKSWTGVSLTLAKGIKLYPEIVKCRSRNDAYVYLQKKNKIRRFLES